MPKLTKQAICNPNFRKALLLKFVNLVCESSEDKIDLRHMGQAVV